MDRNVNSQGLKCNFKKGRGCFCKITRADEFLELMNYFLLGNQWNRSTVRWTESTAPADRVHDFH
jgi:hypothetical protein